MLYTPLPEQSITPQPAIVIGLGQMGKNVIEIMREHQQQRERFGIPDDQGLNQFVSYVCMTTGSESGVVVEEGAGYTSICFEANDYAVDIRSQFAGDFIFPIAHKLKTVFHHVREHARQPLATHIYPKIVLLGATWEPVSCALLWPVLLLIRTLFDDTIPYELLGLFAAADYNLSDEERIKRDAHTFVAIQEGDCLKGPTAVPDWIESISRHFDRELDASQLQFDNIFFIDSLKSNNATTCAHNHSDEVDTTVTALLESLLFTPTYEILDKVILDDYQSGNRQSYIGAGMSSLIVPLRAIFNVLRDNAVGHLITNRLIGPLSAEQKQRLAEVGEEVNNHITGMVCQQLMATETDGSPTPIGENLQDLADNGVIIQAGNDVLCLKFQFSADQDDSSLFAKLNLQKWLPTRNTPAYATQELVPKIGRVKIKGPNQFDEKLDSNVHAVLERLSNEFSTCQKAVTKLANTLKAGQSGLVSESVRRIYNQKTKTILAKGDSGLIEAIELTKINYEQAQKHQAQLSTAVEVLKRSQAWARWHPVDRDRYWFYDANRLQSQQSLKPQLPAILIRGIMLIAVAYQLYWSGIAHGLYFFPLTRLGRFSFPALLAHPGWPLVLLGIVALPMIILMLLLYGLPTLSLHAAMIHHRRILARIATLDLTKFLLEAGVALYSDIADELASQRDRLTELYSEMEEAADRCLSNTGDEDNTHHYWAYQVVTPLDVIDETQLNAIGREAAMREGKVISSWLEHTENGTSEMDLIVVSAEEVITNLKSIVEPVVKDIVMKPVVEYLRPDHYREWVQYIWHGSVPWLKVLTGQQGNNLPPACNVLLLKGKPDTEFAAVVHQEINCHHVPNWFDPYRTQLLRMQCGIFSTQFARFPALQQAFQHLSCDERRRITCDDKILAEFPCTRPKSNVPNDDAPE